MVEGTHYHVNLQTEVDVCSMSRGIDSGAAASLVSPEASLGASSYN